MARIVMKDLTQDTRISRTDMEKVFGGASLSAAYVAPSLTVSAPVISGASIGGIGDLGLTSLGRGFGRMEECAPTDKGPDPDTGPERPFDCCDCCDCCEQPFTNDPFPQCPLGPADPTRLEKPTINLVNVKLI